MKYAVLVGDGMGDYPLPELDGLTPLEFAKTPNMDALSKNGLLGRVQTIPKGYEAGSDVANMSIMGYDPKIYHRGRAPLEAASMGIELQANEVAFRLNLVNLEFSGKEIIIRDHSAGNISSGEAEKIIAGLKIDLPLDFGMKIFSGVSYRHLLIIPDISDELPTLPPHDYLDEDVSNYLSLEGEILPVLDLIRASWPILKNHPVNLDRIAKGLLPANSIWPWGQGRSTQFPSYNELWGAKGSVVSAVDLLKGLGVSAGLSPIDVPGATGLTDTNFKGKVEAALASLKTNDFVLVHVEAPDEASHQGDVKEKIKAIELFDSKVVGPMRQGLEKMGDFRLLVLCDHYTPISMKTHTPEPVPFILFPGPASNREYTESQAESSGLLLEQGHTLIKLLFNNGEA